MPELLLMGAIGFVVCWLINLSGLYLLKRGYQSSSYQNVQLNLAKVGRYWSDNRGLILVLTHPEQILEDQQAVIRSFMRMTFWAAFASWLGVIFVSMLILSQRVLARPRFEVDLMASPLARLTHLTEEDVAKELPRLWSS